MKYKILIAFLAIVIIGCQSDINITEYPYKEPKLPSEVYDYANLSLPNGVFPVQEGFVFEDFIIEINPDDQLVENNKATLGRVLFYDKQLSLNNTISCGSCHHQSKAFSDGLALSPGFEGKLTTRSSMPFNNPIAQRNLFWDSRSFSLADLSLKPVQNHIEMGMEDISALVKKLEKVPYYKPLFYKAYGDEKITEERLSQAIAGFVGSITTNNSKFDKTGPANELEVMGLNIFRSKGKCSNCHGGNNFAALDGPTDHYGGGNPSGVDVRGTSNIGLDAYAKDPGMADGNFRIPSLRNIALTAPYMHDGRFKTLEEVIDHYSSGIKNNVHLDPILKDENGFPIRLNLTTIEKKALVAFLNTLTDEEFISNPKWSDPFQ